MSVTFKKDSAVGGQGPVVMSPLVFFFSPPNSITFSIAPEGWKKKMERTSHAGGGDPTSSLLLDLQAPELGIPF
jgi:hypothetical protein